METALMEEFIQTLRQRGFKPGTVAAYRRDLRYLCNWLTGNGAISLFEMDTETATAFTSEVFACNRSSVAKYKRLQAAYALYGWLRKTGRILVTPFSGKPVIKSTTVPRWVPDTATVRQLLATMRTSDDPIAWRDRTIVDLGYSCGLRLSELYTLNIGDVDPREGTLRVKGKFARERLVPLGKRTLSDLLHYLHRVRPEFITTAKPVALFISRLHGGTRMCGGGINAVHKRIRKKHGIADEFTSHVLRHAFATDLLRGGASVQDVAEMLGHRHITTTERYTRVLPLDLKRHHGRYHPRG